MRHTIRVLHDVTPSTTREDVRAVAQQYVRRIAGTAKPAPTHQAAYDEAVAQVADATERLLEALVAPAAPRGCDELALRSHARRSRLGESAAG